MAAWALYYLQQIFQYGGRKLMFVLKNGKKYHKTAIRTDISWIFATKLRLLDTCYQRNTFSVQVDYRWRRNQSKWQPKTGSSSISVTKRDIIAVPNAKLGFSTTPVQNNILPALADNSLYPIIQNGGFKPEIVITQQPSDVFEPFQVLNWGFRPRPFRITPYLWRPTISCTRSNKMAASNRK